MDHFQYVQDFGQLKTLSDPRRLKILRLLMWKPATLSQLGKEIGEHPARIRHHLKQLEAAGLVELVDKRVVRGFVEKYYRARARAFFLQEILLPASQKPFTFVALGSHDLALEMLAEKLPEVEVLTFPVGSLEGLVALRQGSAQLAGCHLLDIESGEYNRPFVRHFFPDRSITLMTLAQRDQGLLVAAGNPHGIRNIEDIYRPDLRFVNRNQGSGTRLWLDHQLDLLSISSESVFGYGDEVRTHTQVAELIIHGEADLGLGLAAAAHSHDLGFIPLFQERYDLVIPDEYVHDPNLAPFFDKLQSGIFRREVSELGGYDTSNTGEIIHV